MTSNAVMLDAGYILLLSNLDRHLYLQCNEHNNVPIPIPANDHTVPGKSLLRDCHLQRGNDFYMNP